MCWPAASRTWPLSRRRVGKGRGLGPAERACSSRSRPTFRPKRPAVGSWRRGVLAMGLWAVSDVARAQVHPPRRSPRRRSIGTRRRPTLDVRINDWPQRLVARFRDDAGRLSLPADQFEGLGFRLDEAWVSREGEAKRVYLNSVPNLTWRIDPWPRASPSPRRSSFRPWPPGRGPNRAREGGSGRGMLLSYDLFGEWAVDPDAGKFRPKREARPWRRGSSPRATPLSRPAASVGPNAPAALSATRATWPSTTRTGRAP